MRRLALLVVNHARWVIVVAVLFVVVAAVLGRNVADKLSAGGFEDPQSESVTTAEDLLARFPAAGEPDFVVLVTARDGIGRRCRGHRGRAPRSPTGWPQDPAVIEAASYWTLSKAPPLKSTDGRQALIIGTLRRRPR